MLTELEKDITCASPTCLHAIADWHETQQSMADAMGFKEAAEKHRLRAVRLREAAKRIQAKFEC